MTRSLLSLPMLLTACFLAGPVLAQESTPIPRPEPTSDELRLHAPRGCRHEVTRNMKRLALAISGRYATRYFQCPMGSALSDPAPAQLPGILLGVLPRSVNHGEPGKAIDILVSTARGGVQDYLTEDPPRPPEEAFDAVMMDLGAVFLGPTTKNLLYQLAVQAGVTLPGQNGSAEGERPFVGGQVLVNVLGGQAPNNDYGQAIIDTWNRVSAFEQSLYHWYSNCANPFGEGELQDHWFETGTVDNTDPNLTISPQAAVEELMAAAPAGMHWYDYRSDYDSDTSDDDMLRPINMATLAWRTVYAGMFIDNDRANSLRFEFDDDTNNQIYHTFFYAWMMYFTNSNLAVNAGNMFHEMEAGGTLPDFLAALGGIYLGKTLRELRNANVDAATKRQYLAALPSVMAAVFARDNMLPPRNMERSAFVASQDMRSFRREFVCPGGWYSHPWNGNEIDRSSYVWVTPTEWSNPGGIFTLDLYDRVTEIDRELSSKLDLRLSPMEFGVLGLTWLRHMINDPHDFAKCPDTFCLPDRGRD